MKLIYTLIFLLSILGASAQTYVVNDSIYPAKTVLHVGDTLKMVFNAKSGVMRLSADGGCRAQIMHINQFKKPAGWAQIFAPPQMDCGSPYIGVANGIVSFYPQTHTGTYRMVYFTTDGKPIETDEFTVVE